MTASAKGKQRGVVTRPEKRVQNEPRKRRSGKAWALPGKEKTKKGEVTRQYLRADIRKSYKRHSGIENVGKKKVFRCDMGPGGRWGKKDLLREKCS